MRSRSGTAPLGLVRAMQRGHRTTLQILTCVMLFTMAGGVYLLWNQSRVSASTEAVREARVAHAAMLSQETGLRGYLATGDTQFLASYPAARAASERAMHRLVTESIGLDAGLAERLVAVDSARRFWEAWATEAARTEVNVDQPPSAQVTTVLMEGKRLFDAYAAEDDQLTSELVALRDEALADQRHALLGAIVIQAMVLVGGTLAALRRRRHLERTVVRPVDDLLGTVESLRAGDLSVRAVPSGVAELDAVAERLGDLATEVADSREDAARREARLVLLARRFETVVRISREIAGSLSERYICEGVVEMASELLEAPVTIWLRADNGGLRAARRSSDPRAADPPTTLLASPLVVAVAADAHHQRDDGAVAFPLVLAGQVVGVIEAQTTHVDGDARQVLEALSSSAAVALESARLHSQTRALAEVDPLTQLPNRRRMESDLETEIDRCQRYHRPLTFVMVDLDHFKRLNDTHGHPVGDRVLHDVAAVLMNALRTTDSAYRYGGEELALLLRETNLDDAMGVAERMRALVSRVSPQGTTATVTASFGLAALSPGMTATGLVSLADRALYRAKAEGRDRVVVAPEEPPVEARSRQGRADAPGSGVDPAVREAAVVQLAARV